MADVGCTADYPREPRRGIRTRSKADSQGRKACRPTGTTGEQIRVVHESQHRQGARSRCASNAARPRRRGRQPPSFFRRRKPKDEERLFLSERRLRNPHAPRFSAPKIFRGTVAQYLPSRAYRLVTGSFEVRELHSYAVDVGAMIFNVEIVSGHDSAPISTGGRTGFFPFPHTPGA